MKRKTVIGISIILWLVALVAMFNGVEKYIENKDERLLKDIRANLYKVFDKQYYIDVAYSGYEVGYEKTAKPENLLSILGGKHAKKWEDDFGDLNRMYRIKYKSSDWSSPFDYEDGWKLVMLEFDYDGVSQSWLFPYAVGYKRQNDSWMYNYIPSVKTAVEEAFEFWTSDPKSQFIDNFEKGSLSRMWLKIRQCENDYYAFLKDDTPRLTNIGLSIFTDNSNSKSNTQAGYMHNGYYRVFIGKTQPESWSIKRFDWKVESEKRKLKLYWSIGLTLLLLLIVVPLWIIENKNNKIKKETLYEKLVRQCNPANFVKDYDKEKVDKANNIYKELLSISPDDEKAINEIQKLAIMDLGITLIDKESLNELKEKVNPKNYMDPYNAEKISIANDLYSRLNKEELTYSEFVEIEELSKQL